MTKLLDSSRHAVGHAPLASLRVKQMVTTNFDPCMELALEPVLDKDFRVQARQLADGRMPWLLKLNGDIRRPESLTLTGEDFERHSVENAALLGVVQSVLLTSHLLFVGFSFRDKSFLELAEAVSRVRGVASDSDGTTVGTALALTQTEADSVGYPELHMIPMLDDGTDEPARKLEIFLDRLGWAAANEGELAAEYLLDNRYASGLSAQECALREILKQVAACLRDLGAELAE